MNCKLGAIAAVALLAAAAPASAQIVNGLTGPDSTNPPAPIGTKAGGPSALGAPGEDNAMAGAIRNERDFRDMRSGTPQGVEPTPRPGYMDDQEGR
jgi:hypothetical protein